MRREKCSLRIVIGGWGDASEDARLIKLDEIDFTVVGLDELLSTTQYYLKDPTLVTKWGMYNYQLQKPTSIKVAGSAELTRYNSILECEIQDIVGFFLISKKGVKEKNTQSKKDLINAEEKNENIWQMRGERMDKT